MPSSAPVSTASASLLFSDAFSANWAPKLTGIDQTPLIFVDPGQRLHVRLNAPSTAISLNGTLIYEILGRGGLF